MKPFLSALIKLYQQTHKFRHPTCRFTPTCSQYMYDAINKYGTIRGVLLGLKRILRCHPFSKGGHDPVK